MSSDKQCIICDGPVKSKQHKDFTVNKCRECGHQSSAQDPALNQLTRQVCQLILI